MNWIKNLLEYRIISKKDIQKLKNDNATLKSNNTKLSSVADDLKNVLNNITEELNALKQSLLKADVDNLSNEDFFTPTVQKYTFKPNHTDYLHKGLNSFSKDEIYKDKYWNLMKDWNLSPDYRNVDDLIYRIVMKGQKYINSLPDDYKTDKEVFGVNEYWLTPQEAYDYYVDKKLAVDCFAGYEEIYTETGLSKIKDIKVGDKVLSYDFKTNSYVYNKVIDFVDKGNLQVNRIHFRNGQTLDVSENHPVWIRKNKKGKSVYEKKYLSDIELDKESFKRKVPIVKKLPYKKSKPKYNKCLYRVVGHYLAEGFTDKNKWKVDSSGYELIEYIIPILENNNIPFTEYKNNSGVPCIRFLRSEFKDYLKPLKKNSFDITLSEEILSLPEDYLEELLYGMWLGDGTKKIVNIKKSSRDWIYSTSSKKLAEDIQRIGLQLGSAYHIWKQENHQGAGNKPIYRITHNSNSVFLRDFGNEGISEVSISFVEKLEHTKMYDLTVEYTHTVIMKNGIITHQCEDTRAFLWGCIMSALPHYNFQKYAWRLKAYNIKISGYGGHAIITWLKDDLVWSHIETTFVESEFRNNWNRGVDIFKSAYAKPWHIFDEKTEYELK